MGVIFTSGAGDARGVPIAEGGLGSTPRKALESALAASRNISRVPTKPAGRLRRPRRPTQDSTLKPPIRFVCRE